MKFLFIISTNDPETVYNAMRLANLTQEQGNEVAVFMLGQGVTFAEQKSELFDVQGEIDRFQGDFFV